MRILRGCDAVGRRQFEFYLALVEIPGGALQKLHAVAVRIRVGQSTDFRELGPCREHLMRSRELSFSQLETKHRVRFLAALNFELLEKPVRDRAEDRRCSAPIIHPQTE